MKDDCFKFRIYLDILMLSINKGCPIGEATSNAAKAVESYVAIIEESEEESEEEESEAIPESFLIKESLHKESIRVLGRLKDSIVCSLAVTPESQERNRRLGILKTSFGQPYCHSLSTKGIICTCHNCSLYRNADCVYEQGITQ